MENPLITSWQKVEVLTSKQNAAKTIQAAPRIEPTEFHLPRTSRSCAEGTLTGFGAGPKAAWILARKFLGLGQSGEVKFQAWNLEVGSGQ